ncbi:3 beta-hydroxysteroid dehydrogenase/Delta 5--_4-isomerase [Roseimaritima multifibrata]|uniref:3 beta-hydroxysteroid dehydrogenase/Delta 5-->4-isomerase n=1 Tax=Roseimaritima multifibrata TaxID=1930274 RepID=A0A517MLQ8_9BACT|nr:NAD-dependent epimerase/dehydratase family protein [Roseimaritima multifibrata]QDS95813.1 3 beta-hydroxysteroid dehydrogenase/Delta 5-->4-isomerase [Roseimaritima multifibrata]
MKRVLVTGANGFVGRQLCERLLTDGWQVRGTIRRAESAAELAVGVQPVVIGDIATFENWGAALDSVDSVVHLVARTHVMNETVEDPLPLYRQVNVAGTQRLLDGCEGTQVKRFVFVSSIKAVGEANSEPYTELSDCLPEDAYGVSKREAEQLVLETTSRLGIEPVVLRPPLIYGPGVLGNFSRILRAIDRGMPLPLGCVKNRRSLLYVGNFVDAIAICLKHSGAAYQTFHLADGEAVSTNELARHMAFALARKPRVFPVPVPLLRTLGWLTKKEAPISRLVDSLTVSTSKIERMTGWKPSVSLRDGLEDTVNSYRAA